MKKYITLTRRNFTLVGILLGIVFPLLSIVLDMIVRDMAFTADGVGMVYASNKVQWVVLSAPLVLGVLFNILGKIIATLESQFQERLVNEKEQFKMIEKAVANLEVKDFRVAENLKFDITNETTELINIIDKFKIKFHNDRDLERQRQWAMQGLTELNEIITSKQKLEKLAELTLSFIVKYLKCIQGSFFLTRENDTDQYLELAACYAYDRKKFVERRIEIGDGIVGQCFLEKSRITLHSVPQGYVKITSGLGESTPTSLNVIPLLYDGKVEGIIEVASFHKLQPFELTFLDKAGESIGNIFSNVKKNERTEELWAAAQAQSLQMQSQEEEMRQSVEELTAIQEEMERKEKDYIKKIQQLENQRTELERIDWENKHKIQSLQRFLSEKNIEYSNLLV